jgi:predicted HTH domain antitoxin
MMEFNESVLPALHKSQQEFANEISLLAAAKWYEPGIVSQEKAAEIAGLNRLHFLSSVRFEL